MNRAGMAALLPFGFQTLTTLLLCILLVRGVDPTVVMLALLTSALCNAALTAGVLVRQEKEIASAMTQAALVHAAYPRVIEFQVPVWRIVGQEQDG